MMLADLSNHAVRWRAWHVGKQEERLVNESSVRSVSQSEKTARKRDEAAVRYEAESKAIRVKMARRRTLRFADMAGATTAITKKPAKPGNAKFSSLSDWQEQQRKDGRHV
jgi:hypothetical protein